MFNGNAMNTIKEELVQEELKVLEIIRYIGKCGY